MKRKFFLSILLVFAIGLTTTFTACSDYSNGGGPQYVGPYADVVATDGIAETRVYSASVSVQTNEVEAYSKTVKNELLTAGGTIIAENYYYNDGDASYYYELVLPIENFDAFINEIVGETGVTLINKNISSYDVSEEFVPAKTKIATLEETKASLIAIRDAANTTAGEKADIISRISEIDLQIDELQGMIDKHVKVVSNATVVLNVQKNYVEDTDTPLDSDGNVFLWVFGSVMFATLIAIATTLIVMYLKKKNNDKKQAETPAVTEETSQSEEKTEKEN